MEAADTSIIIPVYNGERFLADAIRSVLAQTLPSAELLVVDDASTDGTASVAQRFPGVRYLRLASNSGQAAALNEGVARTTGAYLAFLDADDVWVTDKLRLQLHTFAADPTLDVVYGLMRQRVLQPDGSEWRDGEVCVSQLPSAMLVRRQAFERVGAFDTRWTLGSVVDWYARACEAGLRQTVVPQVVYERRIHGENIGVTRADRRDDYLAVIKAALDRRRNRNPTQGG